MDQITEEKRSLLQKKVEESYLGGGAKRQEKQRSQGKYTARERVDHLLDLGSFIEFDQFAVHRCTNFGLDKQSYLGDGVITGIGEINGKQVAVFSQDFTCWGGALGAVFARKICKIMDYAINNRIPVIGINDSGGARIQEGVESLAGYADIFHRNVQASGVIPQISLIMGPCAGGAVYSPAMTDFIFMVDKTSYMFVTGPEVIKTVTHEEVTKEALGGAKTHSETSGVAHFMTENEDDCFERVRELLNFLPDPHQSGLRAKVSDNPYRSNQRLKDFIPSNSKKPYDMKELIEEVADNNHFLQVQPLFAPNILTGFIQLNGQTIGVVANQPIQLAGVLDIDSSCKAARFVRYCDAFDIPLLTLVDVPGFLPGTVQEYGGIIRHGSKLLFAFSEATVPMVTLITRKAYGGAYDVMASKHIGADINLAYPSAEIAVMGADGAVNIIFRKELADLAGEAFDKKKAELVKNYEDQFANPYRASELGYVDEIIFPEDTRTKLIKYFKSLKNKKIATPNRKHGNIPL